MKKNTTFRMNEVCGEKFLMAEGIENIDVNSLVALNETAAFLWEAMGEGDFSVDELVAKLTAEYEVSEVEARKNIEELLAKMKEAGVVFD